MPKTRKNKSHHSGLTRALTASILALLIAGYGADRFTRTAAQTGDALQITAAFSETDTLAPDSRIVLRLNREIKGGEGRLAVLVGNTDLSPLFTLAGTALTYDASLLPLPVGDAQLLVYRITKDEEWKELARFTLRVRAAGAGIESGTATEKGEGQNGQVSANGDGKPSQAADTPAQGETAAKIGGFETLDVTPSLTIGFKSQALESHFPDSSQPARPTFADMTLQGSLRGEAKRGLFSSQNQFDIAGSSFREEALRFGQLGGRAPRIDLASYLMQFQVSNAKVLVGHTSYGTNRHLINSFSSRGVTVTVPLPPNFDLSLAAMNGTSIVGLDNFFGLDRSKHQILSGTLGAEFVKKRPGGLRLEVSYLNGYVQALNGFTQGSVNDVERSTGLGFRLLASDSKQRVRLDSGFARSQFVNPADPLLEQGNLVVAIPGLAKNARYAEAGIDILKDFAVSETRKATLTMTFRHETVDPLYRSLGASTQADRTQNQAELIATVGDINALFSYTRFNDNLNDIPSILKSLTRAERVTVGAPLVSVFGGPKPSQRLTALLPRVSYSLDRLHQFGAAIPVNGGFEFAPEAIPDFLGTSQSFTSDWQIEKFRVGYRFNHSLQNNRQIGRQLADLVNFVHAITTGFPVRETLDLTFDLSLEQAKNIETQRLDRTYRAATVANWRLPRNHVLAANLAHTFAGDRAGTSRNQNFEFDLQWSHQFTFGKEKFKKLQGQAFIRFANRFASARDFAFGLSNRTRLQTVNIGMNLTFF